MTPDRVTRPFWYRNSVLKPQNSFLTDGAALMFDGGLVIQALVEMERGLMLFPCRFSVASALLQLWLPHSVRHWNHTEGW